MTETPEKVRVLYMEDDAGIAYLLRRELEKNNYDVTIATNGADGMEEAQNNTYDILLVDHQMPYVTGIEVIRHLSNEEDMPPVIVLTGAGSEEIAVEAMRYGAEDYIVKDVDQRFLHLLPTLIQRVLHNREVQEAQKRAELALQVEQERSRLLATFIENASHEFRTPLTIIATKLDRLKRMFDDPQANKQFDGIQRQADNILMLVDNLITMAQLDRTMTLERELIDINKIVIQALSQFEEENHSNLTIELHLADEPLNLQANNYYLYLALTQLMNNAASFSREEGSQLRLCTGSDGNRVVARIQDTGIGMSKEDLSRIFERFYRINKAHTTRGFGLGLPIVQRIIQLHDGTIDVQSEIDKGTTVTISFAKA